MQNIENHMNTNNNNNANPFHIAYNLWRHYKAQKININQDELLTIDQLWTVKKFFLALLLTVRKILTKKTAQQWEEEEEKIIFISQKFSLSLDFFLFLFFFDDSSSTKKYLFTYEKYLSNICIQNILIYFIPAIFNPTTLIDYYTRVEWIFERILAMKKWNFTIFFE